jgi:hypothetical protein
LFHKQLGKDVVHNVLAVVIIVQQQVSQPMHRAVMLPEQPFDMSVSVCHTLYIHTGTDFLNPRRLFSQFFLFGISFSVTKLTINIVTRNTQMGVTGTRCDGQGVDKMTIM